MQSASRTSWQKTFNSKGTFNIRQIVEDSDGATAQLEREITIVNRQLTASLSVPASTNQNSPTKLTTVRPDFRWTYSETEGDTQVTYHVRIYRYGEVLALDSSERAGAVEAWKAEVDLSEKTNMYVQVRVFDGYGWSDWSAARYFYIETNQAPTADFSRTNTNSNRWSKFKRL